MKVNKRIIFLIISIVILLIGISLYLLPEKYTFMQDGTKVTGDIDKVEILNYTVFTYNQTNWPDTEYIGEGFIHTENATSYDVMVYYKNIANEKIEDFEMIISYYNIDNNLLESAAVNNMRQLSDLEKSEISRTSFGQSMYMMEGFEKAERVSFHISNPNDLDYNMIGIYAIIIGILFLLVGLYKIISRNHT